MNENEKADHFMVLGVDIGGSHITAALIDLETRTVFPESHSRKSINSLAEAEEIITNWCDLINACFANVDISEKKIGIAIPGPFDYDKGISLMSNQDKFDSLYRLNIKERLANVLGLPLGNIRFVNDAASFLQGEVFAGAARDYSSVLGLTLGTGLGSSLYQNGIVTDADLWQSPFNGGIAEDYLCSRWFVERYEAMTGKSIAGVKDLVELSGSDPRIKEIFVEFARNLADFIRPVAHKHQTELVVIGGNISNAFELFLKELNDLLKSNEIFVKVEISHLKENAALLGAASCWEAKYLRED